MKVEKQILKGAEELFFRYGLKAITMDDIAKHLGMSKRTIYENFPTKDSIVSALLTEHRNKCLSDNEVIGKEATNAIEEQLMSMNIYKDLADMMNPRLLYELKKFHPKVWGEFRDFKEEVIMQFILGNLKRGIKQGLYRKEIDADILSRLRIEQIEIAWNPELFPPSKFDSWKVNLQFITHFMYGIVTPKGYELIEKYKKSKNLNVLV